MTLIILLAVLLVLLALRVPVFLALLAISLIYILNEPTGLNVIVQRMTSGLESFPLLAIPMFILAGSIMAGGGIAERLMGFAATLVGHFRGGLAQVNVLNSLFIGGMSGSAQADAAIDSKVLVPIMRKHGYSNAYASALTVVSSTISPILPPSIGLILYGVLADVSIGKLFLGGVVPALLIAVALTIAVRVLASVLNHPRARDRRARLGEMAASFWQALPAILMPVLLLVGLRMGVFTPTELSAIFVICALIVSMFIFKQITWRDLPKIIVDAALTSGMLMVILAAAAVFSIIVAYERLPQQLSGLLESISENPLILLLIINLLLLLLGAVVDAMSLMIIMTPVLAPIAVGMGVDPVHFGIIIVLNVTIGSITPPLGSTLYTVTAITGVRMGELVKAFLPFYLTMVGLLMLITYVPAFSTWLPGGM
ncbi:TRAP transporter large permease [Ruicaihuangia caeni]|uniref:TRAP transporter large permease n=1 Tax=Ruicaihuangia caeni TaxID=3042517 RepID=A0AAW6TAH1_9MICO|nr:TRAP transporter large permease [Klugiella sp. YN-L-19]MDI2098778.1 TRAP transporter large permease [Klugiella sp. YN-L-19]